MAQKSPLLSVWSLPQPLFVFGCRILAASAFTTRWMDPERLVSILIRSDPVASCRGATHASETGLASRLA